jgi:hypothetical protein
LYINFDEISANVLSNRCSKITLKDKKTRLCHAWKFNILIFASNGTRFQMLMAIERETCEYFGLNTDLDFNGFDSFFVLFKDNE